MALHFVTLLATIWWRSWKYFRESHVVFHETIGHRGRRRCLGQRPGAKFRGTIALANYTVSDVHSRIKHGSNKKASTRKVKPWNPGVLAGWIRIRTLGSQNRNSK